MKKFTFRDERLTNKDYFLYLCYEFEQTDRFGKREIEKLRWNREERSAEDPISAETAADEVLAWHLQNHPQICSMRPMTAEDAQVVILHFAALSRDIEKFVFQATSASVPEFSEKLTEAGEKFWAHMAEACQKNFGLYSQQLLSYLQWCFNREIRDDEDAASRPPVGRFSAGLAGRIKRSSTGSSMPPRRGPVANTGHDRGKRSESGRDRGNDGRHNQGGRSGGAGGNRDRDRASREDRKRRQQITDAAMREAQDAISKLQSEPTLERVKLNPANSFLRRMQHQLISDHGFTSESTGEADDRSVVILQLGQVAVKEIQD